MEIQSSISLTIRLIEEIPGKFCKDCKSNPTEGFGRKIIIGSDEGKKDIIDYKARGYMCVIVKIMTSLSHRMHVESISTVV